MKPKPTMRIESLLDKEGEYVGVFCAKTGLLLRHEGTLTQNRIEQEEEQEIEPENINQLKLF